MDANPQNNDLSDQMIALLEVNRCTVKEAEDICYYVLREIRKTSTVQRF